MVTGCAGFIGSHLTESLLEDGHVVLGVDCFNENYGRRDKLRNLDQANDWHEFEFVPIDLARGDLDDLYDECDTIFHLAAEPGVRASWGARFDEYLRNNVLATQHLLEAAKRSPEKRFVFASSSSIYGDTSEPVTREDSLPRPYSPYGTTKLAAEHLCGLYFGNYGVQTVSLRYFSVYGPRQRPDMAFNIFCRAAILGETLRVFGDGTQTRDFTYVTDVVAATRAAAEAGGVAGQVYNVGGGSAVSLAHGLECIEGLAGGPLGIDYVSRQRGDVHHTSADTSRARSDLGFEPNTDFESGLEQEFAWMEAMLSRGGIRGASG